MLAGLVAEMRHRTISSRPPGLADGDTRGRWSVLRTPGQRGHLTQNLRDNWLPVWEDADSCRNKTLADRFLTVHFILIQLRQVRKHCEHNIIGGKKMSRQTAKTGDNYL